MDNDVLYFESWYPLPLIVPSDVQVMIYEFVFDPEKDPW